VDLELHDAAVRAAIAGGRLASLSAAADTDNIAWVRDLWALAEPHTTAAYPNFLGDESSDRVRSAFGDSAWQRLVELKRQWDPDNVFRLNHNIPPA